MSIDTTKIKQIIVNKMKDIKTREVRLYIIVNGIEFTGVDIPSKYMHLERWDILHRAIKITEEIHKIKIDLDKDKFDFRFEGVNESIIR